MRLIVKTVCRNFFTFIKNRMKFHWIKTNWLVKRCFAKYIWDIPNNKNLIYLTFDDGPTPEITPWVLEVLAKQNVKATFFCIGDNISKHPEIFRQITAHGHSVGNHTFNHLNGWKTTKGIYLKNIRLCENILNNEIKLFRPPYGKIKPSQAKALLSEGYKIIMWDVLSIDYDRRTDVEKCVKNATARAASGSIIVFHDSVKAFKNLEYALPRTISILKKKGFGFESLS